MFCGLLMSGDGYILYITYQNGNMGVLFLLHILTQI